MMTTESNLLLSVRQILFNIRICYLKKHQVQETFVIFLFLFFFFFFFFFIDNTCSSVFQSAERIKMDFHYIQSTLNISKYLKVRSYIKNVI